MGKGGGTGGEFPPRTSISYLVTYAQILGLFTVVPPPDGQTHAHLWYQLAVSGRCQFFVEKFVLKEDERLIHPPQISPRIYIFVFGEQKSSTVNTRSKRNEEEDEKVLMCQEEECLSTTIYIHANIDA